MELQIAEIKAYYSPLPNPTTTQTNTKISKVKAKTLAALKKIGEGRGDNGTEYPNGRDSKPPNDLLDVKGWVKEQSIYWYPDTIQAYSSK